MLWLSLILATAPPAAAPLYDAAWARSLRPGTTVHLPAGSYAGPWHVGPGVHLVAESGAVLQARQSGAPALVIAGAGVTVEGLSVQAAAGALGIEARDSPRLTLLEVHVAGGSQGVEIQGGDVSWTGGSVEGTGEYGVRAREAHVSLRSVQFRDNKGPALYFADTQAELFHCAFASSEYGVLALRSQVEIVDSDFSKLRRTGIGLTLSTGRVALSHFSGPFVESAISIMSAPQVRIERNRIEQPGSAGIKLLSSTAALEGNTVSGARADKSGLEGTGLFLHSSHVRSNGDVLFDNGGGSVAVYGGRAELTHCRIEASGAQPPAYVAEHGSLALFNCDIRADSPELDIEEGSTADTGSSRFEVPAPDGGAVDAGQRGPGAGSVE